MYNNYNMCSGSRKLLRFAAFDIKKFTERITFRYSSVLSGAGHEHELTLREKIEFRARIPREQSSEAKSSYEKVDVVGNIYFRILFYFVFCVARYYLFYGLFSCFLKAFSCVYKN